MGTLSHLAKTWLQWQLNTAQEEAFRRYLDELMAWNRRFNLTAIREPEEILRKHFLDSLSVLTATGCLNGQRVIDVGTGAGFPGLALKIACPEMRLTLVESVRKKADFCRHIVSTLGMHDVVVIHARAEEVGQQQEHREVYDWAVARAVARLPVLAEYLLPLVRLGGAMLAQKGETGPAEVQDAARALQVLGGEVEHVRALTLPGITETRYLIVVRKQAATPKAYPRRPGVPAKRPLRAKKTSSGGV